MKRRLAIIICLSPALIIYGGFVLFSFGKTAFYSFFQWDGQTAMHFVGLGNFIELFRDSEVTGSFLHNLIAVCMAVVIQIGCAVIMAVVLSRSAWGFKFFRAIYFLPVVVSAVAFALMWGLFLDPQFGLIDDLLRSIGLSHFALPWLSNPRTTLIFALLPQTTQGIGWQMVILLAAIAGIPINLLEAADLEGIRFFQRLRYITIPLIWEATQICIILAVLYAFQGFTHIMILTLGGPNNATTLI
jgi:raffinose/stachyose/melibiose transport system permease protein